MQGGLKKGLSSINRLEKVGIGIGTREIYNDVIKVAAFFYALYGGLFAYLGNPQVSLIFFAGACVNIVLLLGKEIPYVVLVNVEHTLLFILVVYGVVEAGWQYGFQVVLILGIALSFFAPYKKRILVFIFPVIEMVTYLCLLFMYGNKPPKFVTPDPWPAIIHSGLVIGTAILCVYSTQKADIFSLMNSKKMARVAENLVTLANQDELTGLYNRRAIQDILEEKWSKHSSDGEEFYIVMADIDYFKELNDSYGHNTGDAVLQKTATILLDEFRRSDFIARWGGDEFLVVVTNAGSMDEVRDLLERVRLRIENTNFRIEDREDIRITMTFGCASCSDKTTIRNMVASADEQLYIGKNKGRNVVITEVCSPASSTLRHKASATL